MVRIRFPIGNEMGKLLAVHEDVADTQMLQHVPMNQRTSFHNSSPEMSEIITNTLIITRKNGKLALGSSNMMSAYFF